MNKLKSLQYRFDNIASHPFGGAKNLYSFTLGEEEHSIVLLFAFGAEADLSTAHAELLHFGVAGGAGLVFHVWIHGRRVADLFSVKVDELVFASFSSA